MTIFGGFEVEPAIQNKQYETMSRKCFLDDEQGKKFDTAPKEATPHPISWLKGKQLFRDASVPSRSGMRSSLGGGKFKKGAPSSRIHSVQSPFSPSALIFRPTFHSKNPRRKWRSWLGLRDWGGALNWTDSSSKLAALTLDRHAKKFWGQSRGDQIRQLEVQQNADETIEFDPVSLFRRTSESGSH